MPIPALAPIKKDGEYRNTDKRKKWKARLKLAALFTAIACVTLGLIGILGFTFTMAWISRDLPKPDTLMTRDIPQSTKIYDRTGEILLYEIHGDEKRSLVEIGQIPDYVKQATISLEDRAFYEHHGVNWLRVIKAVYIDVIQHRKAQGASTLTQQLVKNAILTNEKSFTRKLKELLLALQIERTYTKDQILQMYLNEIPYGSMIYGIGSASESYFGKPVNELTLDEAALLASIPQAPDKYNPYGTGVNGDNRDLLVQRQHSALDTMVRDGYITRDQAEEAKKIDTLAKLVPKMVSDIKAPHFVMYVREQLIDTYGQKTVEQGGLKVITTLDWNLQQIAEAEVKKGVEKYGSQYKFTNGSLIALDPKTGQILSMVGSKDFWDESIDGQVNITLRPRQPGSSFKPIVYTAGFIKGYTAETILWDVPTIFKTEIGTYKPQNYSPKYNGPVTVRKALQGSLNIPAVKMLYLVGINRVLDFAEQLGYTTFGERDRFGLSLVLGGGEVKLLEHANAYASFANKGVQYPIASILKVTDSSGSVLNEWRQTEGRQVVPKDAALWITNVLSDNTARAYIFGTSNSLTLPDRPVAAKTGTTNNYRDAWTIGYTPNLVAGVWIGNSNGDYMSNRADGSIVAAPVWQAFMKQAVKDLPIEKFDAPPPIQTDKPVLTGKSFLQKLKIDKISGKLATEFTPPEFIEEKEFYTGHNILYYLDKDDPLGPAPQHPENDPQYTNWESAVQDWITKNEWHTTNTAPTEFDDVHTKDNIPTISVISPQNNVTLYSRELTVQISIQSVRRIVRVDVKMDDVLIGQTFSAANTINCHIPNSIERGYHDLNIITTDDVGNRAEQKLTLNLNTDIAPVKITINSPASGSHISQSSFPVPVTISLNDMEGINKIDLKYQQNGTDHLIGSVISPATFTHQIDWSSIPVLGQVSLYAIAESKDGSSVLSDAVSITIDP